MVGMKLATTFIPNVVAITIAVIVVAVAAAAAAAIPELLIVRILSLYTDMQQTITATNNATTTLSQPKT